MPIMTLKVLPYRLTVLIIWSGYLHFHFLSQILRGFISGLDCSQACHYIGWHCFEQNKINFLHARLVIVLLLLFSLARDTVSNAGTFSPSQIGNGKISKSLHNSGLP